MFSNDTYFYLYTFAVLILLIILSVLVFFQVKFFFVNSIFQLLTLRKVNDISLCSEENCYVLLNYYFSQAEYFMCILLCESFLNHSSFSKNKEYFYLKIANSYAQIKYWNVAEYYYLEAISISNQDVQAMIRLAELYLYLGYKSKADTLFQKVLEVNPMAELSSYNTY